MKDGEFDYRKVKRFWNERAGKEGELDRRSITFFCKDPEALEFRDRREKDLFDERVPLEGTEKLLEVGCGSGRWTGFLAERAGRVLAFDFAEELIEVNRRAVEEARADNVDFVVSDAFSLNLPDRDFDLVVCFGVSLYVKDGDLDGFYRNLRRYLKPGGALLSKEPTAVGERIEKRDEYNEKLGTRYSCIYRPRGELEEAIGGAGFRLEWTLPVYEEDEPLAPDRDGVETFFSRWTVEP